MTTPLYNDPTNPYYGPCRRLHIILMQMFADHDFSALEAEYRDCIGHDWTETLEGNLRLGVTEPSAHRAVFRLFDNILDLLRRKEIAARTTFAR